VKKVLVPVARHLVGVLAESLNVKVYDAPRSWKVHASENPEGLPDTDVAGNKKLDMF